MFVFVTGRISKCEIILLRVSVDDNRKLVGQGNTQLRHRQRERVV